MLCLVEYSDQSTTITLVQPMNDLGAGLTINPTNSTQEESSGNRFELLCIFNIMLAKQKLHHLYWGCAQFRAIKIKIGVFVATRFAKFRPNSKTQLRTSVLTPLTPRPMKNTPSIITKTPAALLLKQGERRSETPTPSHQHTQTQGPKTFPASP